jgi:glycosyltransferase involved in cell wall biosynthesis
VKILICIQRYGVEIVGGGESFTRSIAEGLAQRGHTVEVASSTAINYQTWAPHYPAGTEEINGVTVHRFDAYERDNDKFRYLIDRAHGAMILGQPLPPHVEEQWLRMVGPTMPAIEVWLDANMQRFDVALGITYQYAHIFSFTRAVEKHGHIPYAIVPLAHHEVTLSLDVFQPILRSADQLIFLTDEEQQLVVEQLGRSGDSIEKAVLGAPVVLPTTYPSVPKSQRRLRRSPAQRFKPQTYVVAVGRLDPSKGFYGLAKSWSRIRWRRRGFPKLVIVGSGDHEHRVPFGVHLTGFVDDATLDALLRNAIALVHPSSFESFSIVCCEAWLREVPIVVTKDCDVLVGQCKRSGGGLWYDSDAELAVSIEAIASDPSLRSALGKAGRSYVSENYITDRVIEGYEQVLAALVNRGPKPKPQAASSRPLDSRPT